MTFNYDAQQPLPFMGGVVQAQRLFVPPVVIDRLGGFRHACRLAWKLRANRRLTKRQLADDCGLYYSHVTDYFSVHEARRELPARHVAAVERVLGNAVMSQWLAHQAQVTLLEEMQAQRRAA